jgi:hypothetical protein
MRRIAWASIVAALALPAVAFPALVMAQQPQMSGECGVLNGAAVDFRIMADTGTVVVIVNNKTGTIEASSYRCFRFTADKYDLANNRFIPRFTIPTSNTVDAYKSGYNDALSEIVNRANGMRK